MADNSVVNGRTRRQRCPLCQSPDHQPRLTVERRNAVWHVVTCSGCGFTYVSDPRKDTADHLRSAVTGLPQVKPRHRQIDRLLGRLLAKSTSRLVVEVGAGQGALGIALSSRFEYIGFEPAEGLSDAARAQGVRIHQEPLSRERLPSQADAVILDNVLEHVLDPVGLLRHSVDVLRPGGYAIVIVPNVHDVRRFHPRWRRQRHWIPPDHINYFRWKDMTGLMKLLGLNVSSFGFHALSWPDDAKFTPRAAFEVFGLHPFGLNLYGERTLL